MPTRPVQGGSANTWGDELNAWLDAVAGAVPVANYGANPDGSDARAAIQAAADANLAIRFQPGVYTINGGLTIRDNAIWIGSGVHSDASTSTVVGTTKLLFTGTAAQCIGSADEGTTLVHAGLANMAIRATGTYDWIFDLVETIAWKMSHVRMEVSGNATGGFRNRKISAGNSSWVLQFDDVQIRIPDASTKRPLDIDVSDSTLLGGSFTGGIGSILRGTGAVMCHGVRFDHSTAACLTISNETESKSTHQIVGCEIELATTAGILVDGDVNDGLTETMCSPMIIGNHFRNPSATDIVFQNATGPVLHGGCVIGNTFGSATSTPLTLDTTRWTDVKIALNNYNQGTTVSVASDDKAEILARGLGVKGETYPLLNTSAVGAPTLNQVFWTACAFRKGEIVTNLGCVVSVTASPTSMWLGLYDSAGNRLALTADTPTIASGGTGGRTAALTAPYTIPTTGLYYIAQLQVGGTAATLARVAAGTDLYKGFSGGVRPAQTQTGQTTLPVSATFVATVSSYYFVWS